MTDTIAIPRSAQKPVLAHTLAAAEAAEELLSGELPPEIELSVVLEG